MKTSKNYNEELQLRCVFTTNPNSQVFLHLGHYKIYQWLYKVGGERGCLCDSWKWDFFFFSKILGI